MDPVIFHKTTVYILNSCSIGFQDNDKVLKICQMSILDAAFVLKERVEWARHSLNYSASW